VLGVPQHRCVIGVFAVDALGSEVFLVLPAQSVDDLRVCAEASGDLRQLGERLLGGENLREVAFLLRGRASPGRHPRRQRCVKWSTATNLTESAHSHA
jgi:hypothetical protein